MYIVQIADCTIMFHFTHDKTFLLDAPSCCSHKHMYAHTHVIKCMWQNYISMSLYWWKHNYSVQSDASV